jgi:hypothetical protein
MHGSARIAIAIKQPLSCARLSRIIKSSGQNQGPALKQRRAYLQTFFKAAVERLAELFSGLFYVAASRFNSPRFCHWLLKHCPPAVSTAPQGR